MKEYLAKTVRVAVERSQIQALVEFQERFFDSEPIMA
jgi:Holliday junction resolvase